VFGALPGRGGWASAADAGLVVVAAECSAVAYTKSPFAYLFERIA
jgi:hypothetical protein